MIDLLLDSASNALERGLDAVTDNVGRIAEVISTALLISGSICVGELSIKTIKSELSHRRELQTKGVDSVLIQDFIAQQSDCIVVTLAALNAERKQVGTVIMQAKKVSALKEKQLIKI